MEKKIIPRYEVVICKQCKHVVWKKDFVEDEIGRFRCNAYHEREDWLAYDPEWKIITDKDEDPIFAPCSCKEHNSLSYEEIAEGYRKLQEEREVINKKMEHLRGVCKHEDFYLCNFGDIRNNEARKFCKACDCPLDYPNKEEIDAFLKQHPNYQYERGSLTYTGEAVDFKKIKLR